MSAKSKPTKAAAAKNSLSMSDDVAISMFESMLRIRAFEDKIHESFLKGLVFGTTHLCQGQEAISVGAIETLRADDYLTYTYRGHAPCIARGMDPKLAFAEIFGRKTGVSAGLGGSMHLTDMDLGLIGSFAIVGAGLPVAVGAAFTGKFNETGQVALTFFGDGSTNIGAFHESMNLAAVWKLPIVFICENNQYGEYSPILSTTPFEDLYRRGAAYDIPSECIDGNDLDLVYQTLSAAIARARDGHGPSFIECKTYRQCGHSRSDPAKYRPPGELEAWIEKDPIPRFRDRLLEQKVATTKQLAAIEKAVNAEIDEAAEWAEAADFPEVRDLTSATYAGEYAVD